MKQHFVISDAKNKILALIQALKALLFHITNINYQLLYTSLYYTYYLIQDLIARPFHHSSFPRRPRHH